ncbi:MAG TPA: methylated-DNA--[protein]-cysteine S-methyltransferase [Gaiellaceae bacterium]|nr:methylated-DNA--[protein]-cysteine S-methyltransferase [Gaiellaceae bacterium]
MPVREVSYEVDGWGTGTIWLEDGVVVWHELPAARNGRPEAKPPPVVRRLQRYFGGKRDDFADVEIDLDWCTPFQRAVAETLRAVPYGEVVTYGELAALAGYPNAQRAAGTFCAHNRLALIVPCHRVVSAGGLGSYGSLGEGYKRRLLELEGVRM